MKNKNASMENGNLVSNTIGAGDLNKPFLFRGVYLRGGDKGLSFTLHF